MKMYIFLIDWIIGILFVVVLSICLIVKFTICNDKNDLEHFADDYVKKLQENHSKKSEKSCN